MKFYLARFTYPVPSQRNERSCKRLLGVCFLVNQGVVFVYPNSDILYLIYAYVMHMLFIAIQFIQLISYHFESYIFKLEINKGFRVKVMVFSATFNNISVTSWRSVLLVEETG